MAILLFILSLLFFGTNRTYAAADIPQEATGYDISYPQCGIDFPPSPFDFSIIGVNGGKAFTNNACLMNEFIWANKSDDKPMLYINLNSPSGHTKNFGSVGPLGTCKQNDRECQAYNYGYNAAQYAYEYARSRFAYSTIWWIDIETTNTWSDDFSLNAAVLNGAIRFFDGKNVQTGIYSTRHEWQLVMGDSFTPIQHLIHPVPNWVGGADSDTIHFFCYQPFSLNSPVWVVQTIPETFDQDYTCL